MLANANQIDFLTYSFHQFSSRFVEIARHFGDGATYDAIHKRYKVIAEQSRKRGHHNSPATVRRGPRPARVRFRRDGTATLEPDDLEVIEQGYFRKSALPLRNGSSRHPRATDGSVGRCASSPPEVVDIEQGEYVPDNHEESPDSVQSAVFVLNILSSVEPMSCSFEAGMPAKVHETLDGRLARSFQEHAEQRAQSRLMYMEAPPNKSTDVTSPSWQQPVLVTSSASGAWKEIGNTVTSSYVDQVKHVCLLCKIRFPEGLGDALQHEVESKLHQSNLQNTDLVRAANGKLAKICFVPPPESCKLHRVPGRTTKIDDSHSLPALEKVIPCLPVFDTIHPSLGTRDSPVIVEDESAHPDKGKHRAVASETPIAVRRVNYAEEMRLLAARGKRNLPSCASAFEVIDDVAMALDEGTGREPSSSDWSVSVCDDPQDEDYIE